MKQIEISPVNMMSRTSRQHGIPTRCDYMRIAFLHIQVLSGRMNSTSGESYAIRQKACVYTK
jgi:hypothetical protein